MRPNKSSGIKGVTYKSLNKGRNEYWCARVPGHINRKKHFPFTERGKELAAEFLENYYKCPDIKNFSENNYKCPDIKNFSENNVALEKKRKHDREYSRLYRAAHRKSTTIRKKIYHIMEYEPVPEIDEKKLEIIQEYCIICKHELTFREKLFGSKCIKCTK